MKVTNKQCCKCKAQAATVLIRQAYYCQTCFHYVFIGKYRSILIRLRNHDRITGKVLLACSGGPSSIALLDLTKNFMRVVPTEKKKIQVIPEAIVCHIDESTLFEANRGASEKLAENVKERFGFEYFSHRLEQVFDPTFRINESFDKILKSTSNGIENGDYEHIVDFVQKNSTKSNEELLKELFANVKTTTAKEDLLWNLKMEMLVSVAKREGCSYIFMADSATRQAIKMISMTSKGRGYSVALDVSVDDQQSFKGLTIMRPMKDMLAKEIGFYNYFTKCDKLVVCPFNFSTMQPGKSSIDRLTEEFIIGIEKEFSSTVSTICRTALKLTPAADMDYNQKCAMCLMPFESGVKEWRNHITVTDVEDSELPVKDCANNSCGSNNCCGNGGCNENTIKADLNKTLCYSCQVNLKDYNSTSIENLPPYISETVYDKSRDRRLLNQIKDFLITDDE